MSSPGVSKQRVEILNKYGEKLVGVLHSTGSKNLVILCHGFRSTKDEKLLLNLIAALTKEGMSAFHFDFSGNGESEGEFQYGNYRKEADDLRAVVLNLSEKKFKICAISGHSKDALFLVETWEWNFSDRDLLFSRPVAVEDNLNVGGGVQDGAGVFETGAEGGVVDEIAVVGDGKLAEAVACEEGLDVGEGGGGTGGGVANVADGWVVGPRGKE
ncbi:uncharacterized protein LOC110116765 [Dendrobium catenatum]|uniref:uncharacterized protein LOC110116765 n=1 Tax=Dendrobium catenatum TaxID=906689 RepID=UPI00109FA86D|nr:uncharacterized protein LOC110116765 [Dendrobium catenatum]